MEKKIPSRQLTTSFIRFSLSWGLLASTCAYGQSLQPYQEYDKKIRSMEQVKALKSDLFGDEVNTYDQRTSFVHVDIDLAGSDDLKVALSRRLDLHPIPFGTGGTAPKQYGGTADWDIEVLYISGTFDSAYGWNAGIAGNAPRCSTSFYPKTNPPHVIEEIWSGYTVNIPGSGTRALIGVPPSQFKKPDGKVRLWTTSSLYGNPSLRRDPLNSSFKPMPLRGTA